MRRSERTRADPDLGVLASHVVSGLQRALHEALADGGDAQIGPRHRAVLAYLDTEGSRAIDLARQSGQHKQVIGNLVDDLERAGYVRRDPDPSDRRAKLIVPTRLGLRQMARTDAAMSEIETALAASLGQQNYREFKRSFRQVARLLHDRRLP